MEFDAFYRANYERVRRAMVLAFRDPALGEDVTQEAFYRALRRWPKVSKLDHPEAWTMLVALNCGRDAARRRRHQADKAQLVAGGGAGAGSGTESGGEAGIDDRLAIVDLLASVTDRQKEVIVLRYICQLSVPEIAGLLKCAEGTVKATLHVALRRAASRSKGDAYVDDR
jgi:RNA polymerase sigma-70 factor (ECF subfamily)